MFVVTVARRPLRAGNVASSVLTDECGALNIDGSRVGTAQVSTHSRGKSTSFPKRPTETTVEESGRTVRQDLVSHAPRTGRWPANLILEHMPACRRDGTRKVKGHGDGTPRTAIRRSGVHAEAGGHQTVGSLMPVTSHADADGTETVDSWVCAPGCPVAELDQQSEKMGMHGAGFKKPAGGGSSEGGWGFIGQGEHGGARYGDTGGASRFFKQVGGQK